MMRSLFSGISGLKNHQTRMDVIGNNISNVNTTGFKSSRVTFADSLNQTLTGATSPKDNLGGTNPKQIGMGSSVASVDLLFTDGSVQSTGKNTDLCLSGNGLFVVKQGSQTYYTRNGAFEFDAEGNYVLPGSGLFVQGWTGTNGVIDTTAAVGNIVVPAGKSMAAAATSNVTYANNLNSAAPTITSISYSTVTTNGNKTVKITCDDDNDGVIDRDGDNIKYTTYTTITTTGGTPQSSKTTSTTPTTVVLGRYANSCIITMSDGSKITQTSGSYRSGASLPVTTTTTIYDTLGNAHSVVLYFTKTSIDSVKGNTWTVSVNTDGTGTNQIHETDGTLTTVTMTDAQLNFTTSGGYNSGSPTTATLTLTNGANQTQQVTIDLSSLTQYAGNSTINATSDGNAAGTLSSVSIDSSGVIMGTYTNGIMQSEAQVAIAQFTNASGLTKTGNSLYQESSNSGTPNVKTAGDLGVTITPSSLEMSNVDVANEFADMIITQRGFQSNSKIITVGDEMLETLINMKR